MTPSPFRSSFLWLALAWLSFATQLSAAESVVAHGVPGDSILVGTVYNIFHEEFATDADFYRQVDRDLPAIAAAKLDYLMIFPLGQWDPATRTLRWERTDYLIHKIEALHLKFVPLMLKEEQCSYYFPIWKFKEIPGLWDERNVNNGNPNNRENVDFADPRIFPLVEDYFRQVIGRYGKSPALAFYNIWNEPHYSSTAPHVVERFRVWLKKKYGSLAELRRVWGDDYTDWDQVTPFLNDDWNSSMPGIDWTLFRTELDGELLGEVAAMLRKYDQTHPINANPVGTPFANFAPISAYNTDNWQFTKYDDFNGASYYPDTWDREHQGEHQPLWLHNLSFDVFRCAAGDKGYILTELYTNAKTGLTLSGYLDGTTARNLAWTALANDCKGMIYWKWQPFLRGRQSLGRGLVGLDGQLAPRGEAVKTFATTMKEHGQALRSAHPVPAKVGIVIDLVGLLKVLQQPGEPRVQTFVYQSIAGVFRALDEANLPVDLLRSDLGLDLAKLSQYKVLFLPFQVVVRPEVASLLTEYVRQGGCVVADARTGTLDAEDYAYAPSPNATLTDLFGATRRDWVGEPRSFLVQVTAPKLWSGAFNGKYYREQLQLRPKTEVLGVFADNGEPALVENHLGRGTAILAAVPLGASYHDQPQNPVNQLMIQICAAAGVEASANFTFEKNQSAAVLPMIRVHENGEKRIVYLLNSSDQPVKGELVLPRPAAAAVGTFSAFDIVGEKTLECRTDGAVLRIPVSLPALGVMTLEVGFQ